MDEITHAYKKVRGECPSEDYDLIAVWHLRKTAFTSGWHSALAWKEEEHERQWQELLEIEKDVLQQQTSAREGR